MREYSKEIANVIKEVLGPDNDEVSFNEEDGVFTYERKLRGIWGNLCHVVHVLSDSFIVTAYPRRLADTSDGHEMVRILEAVDRINFCIKEAKFMLDLEEGIIACRIYTDCSDGVPGKERVNNALSKSHDLFDVYGYAIIAATTVDYPLQPIIDKCASGEVLAAAAVGDPTITLEDILTGEWKAKAAKKSDN